ncbi:MAG: 3'(2'),5'-bisphosphate nucleotidase CysQ [Hyphomicrobiales bacterium]|nr:3'(2'),5'-bisphosphate nucleotidase CysQ [Hyphomicrobiales bacterium]
MLDALAAAAIEAGQAILEIAKGDIGLTAKADESPVTLADARAEAIVLAVLADAFPDVPVVAEESVAAGRTPGDLGRRFFLVDPLDGTREFVAGNGEYTVNVALVEDGRPVAGVVYAPALGEIFEGRVGEGAWGGRFLSDGAIERRRLATHGMARAVPIVTASRSHAGAETEALLAALGPHERVAAGSSLKFARLAEGRADLYPRLGRTMEWDTAAGEAVLRAAGGEVLDLDGRPLRYGKRDVGFANPWFVADADGALGKRARRLARGLASG